MGINLSPKEGRSGCGRSIASSDDITTQKVLFALQESGIINYFPEETASTASLEVLTEKPLVELSDVHFKERLRFPAGSRVISRSNVDIVLPRPTTEDTYTDPEISYKAIARVPSIPRDSVTNTGPKITIINNSNGEPANFKFVPWGGTRLLDEMSTTSEVLNLLREAAKRKIEIFFE